MSRLARSCALQGITVDAHLLYTTTDLEFLLWVEDLVETVVAAKRQAEKEAKRTTK